MWVASFYEKGQAPHMKIARAMALIMLLWCVGCSRIPQPSPTALIPVSAPPLADSFGLPDLATALGPHITILRARPLTPMQFGANTITRGEYATSLSQLHDVLLSGISEVEKLDYIRQHFTFMKSPGASGDGKVLLTGYFEPVLRGSLTKSAQFSQPLYARPPDLLNLDLTQFSDRFKDEAPLRARVVDNKVLPYLSRAEIDGENSPLGGQGLELAWVDPIDAFFLQIQGSGAIQLQDGQELVLNYADKNGHRYEAIGVFLKERIAPRKVSMQSIRSELARMTAQERIEILFKNPSYVFFKTSTQRAVTALGAPAYPHRTIASDPKTMPKGGLGFLVTKGNESDSTSIPPRFVLDQDTGGAIKGFGRVDLFCGRGPEAATMAGPLQAEADLYYLLPKSLLP